MTRNDPTIPYVLLLLLLLALGTGHGLAAEDPECLPRKPDSSRIAAFCTLEVVGKGRNTTGLDHVQLHCNTTSGDLMPVGIASAAKNSPLADFAATVRQQLEQHGSGITIVQPDCQQQAETPAVTDNQVPLYGLLYFCEGSITLVNPMVRDLYLPYTLRSRVQDDTAPVVVGGTARVSVVGARAERADASTVFAVVQDAELSIMHSAFNDLAGNPGSAVYARERSAVRIISSNFTNSSSTDVGGALAIMGCCNATVHDSLFFNCSADESGGGLYAIEQASLVVSNTAILNNSAAFQGGGIFCLGRYLGLFNGTKVVYNSAGGSGGGLHMSAQQGRLVLSPDTVVSRNKALGSDRSGPAAGGGAFVGYQTKFDASVMRAVVHNNLARRDANVGTVPDKLLVLTSDVLGYVARPDQLDGGLRVEVRLLGEGGFACEGRNIRAYWDSADDGGGGGGGGGCGDGTAAEAQQPYLSGPPKQLTATNASGVAVMQLRFQEPPGVHKVTFMVEGLPFPCASMQVQVRKCWKGEQEERPGVCRVCPKGRYNFEPGLCAECPPHARCPGGSAVLPKPGFWLSSPQHNVTRM